MVYSSFTTTATRTYLVIYLILTAANVLRYGSSSHLRRFLITDVMGYGQGRPLPEETEDDGPNFAILEAEFWDVPTHLVYKYTISSRNCRDVVFVEVLVLIDRCVVDLV